MRLFGKVDGTIDNLDRPFFLGDIFTLDYGELIVGSLDCQILVKSQLESQIFSVAYLDLFSIKIEAP